jgi:hypothetical protein
LYIPRSRNEAAIDAVVGGALLQMTVSLDHPLKHKYIKPLVQHLQALRPNMPIFIVFAVPEDKFDNFTAQNYLNDKNRVYQGPPDAVIACAQFAMCIPLS